MDGDGGGKRRKRRFGSEAERRSVAAMANDVYEAEDVMADEDKDVNGGGRYDVRNCMPFDGDRGVISRFCFSACAHMPIDLTRILIFLRSSFTHFAGCDELRVRAAVRFRRRRGH